MIDDLNKFHITHQPCPSCPSSDGYSEAPDGHGYCFACDKFFPPKDSSFGNFTYEYLPWRSVQASTMKRYDVKTKINEVGAPVALGFGYSNGSFKIRSLTSKAFWSEEGPNGASIAKAGLFGKNKFSSGGHKTITITEGELDALSLHQVIAAPVVSVQSSVVAARDCTIDRSWLNSFDKIILAFDGDEPGRRACQDVARLFDYNKVYVVKFSKYKDANDYLVAGEPDELKRLWWNAKKFLPENVVSDLADFKKILSEPIKQGVSFPFKKLTEMTYGIRKGESILVTALPKVGKTEFMHFVEYHLLTETDFNVGAIYLEEPKRQHLQALASIHLGCPVRFPETSAVGEQVVEAVNEVVGRDDRLHIYSHFGSDDPDILLDTVRFLVTARACDVVLLDHLSLVVSGLAGEDERRALDYIATRLEMMVKELNFALIFVSHVNDHGQTRGSRIAGQICDTRIDISRDNQHPDEVARCTWLINLAYSRFSGKGGPAGRVTFDINTYSCKEEGVGDFATAVINTGANDNGLNTIHRAA